MEIGNSTVIYEGPVRAKIKVKTFCFCFEKRAFENIEVNDFLIAFRCKLLSSSLSEERSICTKVFLNSFHFLHPSPRRLVKKCSNFANVF